MYLIYFLAILRSLIQYHPKFHTWVIYYLNFFFFAFFDRAFILADIIRKINFKKYFISDNMSRNHLSPKLGCAQIDDRHQSPSPSPECEIQQSHCLPNSPQVPWDIKPNMSISPHLNPRNHPSYIPQYNWYQPDPNHGLLT